MSFHTAGKLLNVVPLPSSLTTPAVAGIRRSRVACRRGLDRALAMQASRSAGSRTGHAAELQPVLGCVGRACGTPPI